MRFIFLKATLCIALAFPQDVRRQVISARDRIDGPRSDGSFGVSSPIFLDNLMSDGWLLGSLPIPSDQIVTSFSSKSELALNRSVDGRSITFMGYQDGPGRGGFPVSPTAANPIDISASNTPAVCDPTNPVITSFVSTPIMPRRPTGP
jgi:hypothetical protein